MPISSAVVLPVTKDDEKSVLAKLEEMSEVEVHGVGDEGIAIVMEAESKDKLVELSEEINDWEDVVDFQLAYYNTEEVV